MSGDGGMVNPATKHDVFETQARGPPTLLELGLFDPVGYREHLPRENPNEMVFSALDPIEWRASRNDCH